MDKKITLLFMAFVYLTPVFATASADGVAGVAIGFKVHMKTILELIMYFSYFTGVVIALKILVRYTDFSNTQDANGDKWSSWTKDGHVVKMLVIAACFLSFGFVMDVAIETLTGSENKPEVAQGLL
ncbi:MAG: hypothetical protein AB7U85_11050 [Alphaproteobacteria bacterium]